MAKNYQNKQVLISGTCENWGNASADQKKTKISLKMLVIVEMEVTENSSKITFLIHLCFTSDRSSLCCNMLNFHRQTLTQETNIQTNRIPTSLDVLINQTLTIFWICSNFILRQQNVALLNLVLCRWRPSHNVYVAIMSSAVHSCKSSPT